MLNRRHLRIKVMQALYAQASGSTDGVDAKNLQREVQLLNSLYYYVLALFAEVLKYSAVQLETHESRFIKETEDPYASRRPSESVFVKSAESSLEVRQKFEAAMNRFELTREEVQIIFNSFKETQNYRDYVTGPPPDPAKEKEILTALLRHSIFESEIVFQMMEEKYTPWYVDENVLKGATVKTIKNLYNKGELNLEEFMSGWEEEKGFVAKLFETTISNDDEFEVLIKKHSSHWELERIARMDIIILKMAIAELLYFPLIPIKVSINEYIEMAKNFSTPKSKNFVNGVLDAVIQDLKKSEKIEKFGRGLIE